MRLSTKSLSIICGSFTLLIMASCAVPQDVPPKADEVSSETDIVRELNGYLVTYIEQDNRVRRQARLAGVLTLNGPCVAVSSGSSTQILALPKSAAIWDAETGKLITDKALYALGSDVSFGGFTADKRAVDFHVPETCTSQTVFMGYSE